MTTTKLDLSFLYELAGNDTVYIYEVIGLFLKNVPGNLNALETSVRTTDDYETIQRQAHALKSSAGIIKVNEMYDDLVVIESLAREKGDKNKITTRLDNILVNFKEALPLIVAEQKRYQPVK
jgi:HPt (histidine-containing phosphotransfer) domain-containing protein